MRVDRRLRRHNETIQEILDVAIEVMAEEGVAALSLAEVARRMGMRPPSLYQYFPSKLAVYDALFERGMRQTLAVEESYQSRTAENPLEGIAAAQAAWNGWVMANPVARAAAVLAPGARVRALPQGLRSRPFSSTTSCRQPCRRP